MKYVVPLVVFALVVGGFAYYAIFSTPAPDLAELQTERLERTGTPVPVSEQPEERQSFSGEGSLYSLVTGGDSLECAITYIPNPVEPEIQGGIFTNEGDVRGDFVVPTPDLSGQMVTSIIIAAGTVWQWTDIDGEVVGSRQEAEFSSSVLSRLVAPIGFDTTVQYSCLTWPQVDNTIFEAPATVDFTDVASATFEEGVIYEEEGEF